MLVLNAPQHVNLAIDVRFELVFFDDCEVHDFDSHLLVFAVDAEQNAAESSNSQHSAELDVGDAPPYK